MSVEFQTDGLATPPNGTTIASDQVSGQEFQKVKLAYGGPSAATDVTYETGLPVRVASSTSAFGDLVVANNTPFIQSAPLYGYLPANFRAFTATGGTSGISAHEFAVTTGTNAGGYGAIQSFRGLNYKAGEGGMARMTGRFATGGVALSEQGVGLLNIGDEISFGFNGTAFGTWHRHNGKPEIQLVTVTATPSGGENLTLTLNSVVYTIPLTNATVQTNATEIANYLTANATELVATQNNDQVTIVYLSDGDKAGTFSFSSGTATGTILETTEGVTKTSDFTAQTEWNIDTAAWLDPTKGNVYQVQYQYLGYGAITYSIENPDTGSISPVHRIRYANVNTQPSLGNPSMHVGLYAYSAGSTTNISAYSASVSAFVQGSIARTRNPRSANNVKTSVTTAMTNIMTLRNRKSVNGNINQIEVTPLQLSVFTETTKGATIEIYGNTTLGGIPNYQYTGTNLVMEKDTAGTTTTGGRLLASYVVPGNSTLLIDLTTLAIRIPPTLAFTIAGKVNSGASNTIGCSLVYYEDV